MGIGDDVQGTLQGAGAGHHVIGAVATVGAIWIAAMSRYPIAWRCVAVALLASIPFLADAKQVVLALPAILIIGRWRSPKDLVVRTAAVTAAVGVLVFLIPAGQSAVRFINEKSRRPRRQGRSGDGAVEQR